MPPLPVRERKPKSRVSTAQHPTSLGEDRATHPTVPDRRINLEKPVTEGPSKTRRNCHSSTQESLPAGTSSLHDECLRGKERQSPQETVADPDMAAGASIAERSMTSVQVASPSDRLPDSDTCLEAKCRWKPPSLKQIHIGMSERSQSRFDSLAGKDAMKAGWVYLKRTKSSHIWISASIKLSHTPPVDRYAHSLKYVQKCSVILTFEDPPVLSLYLSLECWRLGPRGGRTVEAYDGIEKWSLASGEEVIADHDGKVAYHGRNTGGSDWTLNRIVDRIVRDNPGSLKGRYLTPKGEKMDQKPRLGGTLKD
jgi:hypothetical protein